MRIALLDKSAAHRLELEKKFSSVLTLSRDSVGYLPLTQLYPATLDDVIHGSTPDLVAIGPNFSTDEVFSIARDIREKHKLLPLIAFLSDTNYNLRILRRLHNYFHDLFIEKDPPARILHSLLRLQSTASSKTGKLLTVSGVRGGVGTTSLVTALAHSAASIDQSCCIVDLSQHSDVLHFLGAKRHHSNEYAAYLYDRISPEHVDLEELLTETPCGLTVLLPPNGGTDIRELWLRNTDSFEFTLGLVDRLRDTYNLVILDNAHADGILSFSLSSRAEKHVLVTTNEPASAYLLKTRLENFPMPSSSQKPGLNIVFNLLYQHSLTKDDIIDFLYTSPSFSESQVGFHEINFDPKGRDWVGTRNSFYTEAQQTTKVKIDSLLRDLLDLPQENYLEKPPGTLARLWRQTISRRKTYSQHQTLCLVHDPQTAKKEMLSCHTPTNVSLKPQRVLPRLPALNPSIEDDHTFVLETPSSLSAQISRFDKGFDSADKDPAPETEVYFESPNSLYLRLNPNANLQTTN